MRELGAVTVPMLEKHCSCNCSDNCLEDPDDLQQKRHFPARNVVGKNSMAKVPSPLIIQERKSNLNIKSLGRISRGRPGGYPCGRPGPKTLTPLLGAQENIFFCADILDPKVWTSMIRGGLRKTLCKKTADLSFMNSCFLDILSFGLSFFVFREEQ